MKMLTARAPDDLFDTIEAMQLHRGGGRSEMIIKLLGFSVNAKQQVCGCAHLASFDDWPMVNNRCGDCGRVLEEEKHGND